MPKFTEIISELESLFPKRLQEDYDNAGIQVFSGVEDITQCLVTLDVTEEVVDEAIACGCDLIISHHPIIFGRGLMNISPESQVGRIVLKAVKNSVSIYCAHTNADSMPLGTVGVMFEKLGIKEFSMLKRFENEDFECGSGGIGELPQSIGTMDFLKKVKAVFNCGSIRYTEIIKPEVKKIAICPGSGSFLLKEAVRQKADVFLSGDFTYHKFFEADKKILIADLGHFETEIGIKNVFKCILQKKFTNFAVKISEINTNPIKYL
ncbi:MAG: Nif3-like dinuclear metal center hexameric protein [Bacteroidales bacterium]|nr:Nif3-like dinuclear metal center hexameric protein [Bacteroidales bacterium]